MIDLSLNMSVITIIINILATYTKNFKMQLSPNNTERLKINKG